MTPNREIMAKKLAHRDYYSIKAFVKAHTTDAVDKLESYKPGNQAYLLVDP